MLNAIRHLLYLFASGFFFGIASVVGSYCLFLGRQENYGNSLFKTVFLFTTLSGLGLFTLWLLAAGILLPV